MSLTFDDLVAGIDLPEKSVYIETLEDSILIKPVPLDRYKEYTDLDASKQTEFLQVCIAESLTKQANLTHEDAQKLIEQVRAKVHPAAWEEIQRAVMITMFGDRAFGQAEQIAGNG